MRLLVLVVAACPSAGCTLSVSRFCRKTEDCITGACVDGRCEGWAPADASTEEGPPRDSVTAEPSRAPDDSGAAGVSGDGGPADSSADAPATADGDGPAEDSEAGAEGGGRDSSPAGEILEWATWPMPNPPYLGFATRQPTGLPNLESYEYASDSVVVLDRVTGLVWQRDAPDTLFDAQAAKAYCADLLLEGYDDWRLPSRLELTSIIDYTTIRNTMMDLAAFPGARAGTYWTASPTVNVTRDWYVDFMTAVVAPEYETAQFQARCVRRPEPQAPLPEHYDLSEAGAVRDNWTMLTWQRVASSSFMNGYDAVVYCRMLAPAGSWRLPTFKESETLVSEKNPLTPDLTLFPEPEGVASDPNVHLFWTSSWNDNNPDFSYWVDSIYGDTNWGPMADSLLRARCVR